MRSTKLAAGALFVLGACGDARPPRSAEVTGDPPRSALLAVGPRALAAVGALAAADVPASRLPFGASRDGDLEVCTSGACAAHVALRRAELSTSDGVLVARAAGTLGTGPIDVRYAQSWPCGFTAMPECTISIAAGRELELSARLRLGLDRATGLVTVDVADVAVPAGLDASDVSVRGRNGCGATWCNLAGAVGLTRFIASQADALARAEARRAIEDATGARCRAAGEPECPALGLVVEHPDAPGFTLRISAADHARVSAQGLELGLRVAARAARARCAAELPPRELAPLDVGLLDALPRAGDVRLVVGERALAAVADAVLRSGLACGRTTLEGLPVAPRVLFPSLARLPVSEPSILAEIVAGSVVSVLDDGSISFGARGVRLALEARVFGREMRLASATFAVTALGWPAVIGDRVMVEVPADRRRVELVSTASSPMLGASRAELAAGFGALATVARGLVPERAPVVRHALLAHLRLARRAGVGSGVGRAVLVDLELATP